MNYLEYYGLTQEPFSNATVGRFYYNSAQHSQALSRLMFAVETRKGLALLVGDIGTGKTTLARRMLDQLPEDKYEAALLVIIHSGITAQWLLRRIAIQLGVSNPAEDKLTLLGQLYGRLNEIAEAGRTAVVLIDEAQMLRSREIMEEFRGMLNLESADSKLITFVLFGLPDIEENMKLDPPLRQRVALKFRLQAFNLESTSAYTQHRLKLTGARQSFFPAAAVREIHRFSRGIPRLINILCDNGLFEGFILRQREIGPDVIRNIAVDLGLDEGVDGEASRSELATPAQVAAGSTGPLMHAHEIEVDVESEPPPPPDDEA
jgi:type II secretory pathway predicted ATPase ExeA